MLSKVKLMLLSLVLLLVACQEPQLQVGATAPNIQVRDVAGNQLTLADWRGKAVVLNFWSASCGPCMAEMTVLDQISKATPEGLVIVGVNTDAAGVDMSRFLQKTPVSYPIAIDQLGISQARYKVAGTPTTFLLDKQGVLRHIYQGAIDEAQLKQDLNQITP